MSSIWVYGLEDISPLMIGHWAHSPSFNWLKMFSVPPAIKTQKVYRVSLFMKFMNGA